MSLVTQFINLIKPEKPERFSLSLYNGNNDKIDAAVGKLGGHKPHDAVEINSDFYTAFNNNFTLIATGIVRKGSLSYFFVNFRNKAGLGIDLGTGGFIGGAVPILLLNQEYRPLLDMPIMSITTSDRVVAGYAQSTGQVSMKAVSGNAQVPLNTEFKLAGLLLTR